MTSSLVRWSHFPALIAVLVATLVALALAGVRSLGVLETVELTAYDAFTRLRHSSSAPDARIALVTITEGDIRAYGWPLSDRVLAETIQAIARHQPRAIGLDIYRDVPQPPGTEQLEAVLRGEQRVIGLVKLGQSGVGGVPPPRVLRGSDRVGFSDVLPDPGGVVRRGLLFLDEGSAPVYSFPLRLALLYLRADKIVAQPGREDPSHLRLGRATIPPLESNDGGYVGADARGYQFLLDFKGARQPFAAVDLTGLLRGSFEPRLFRDKIVLIGVTAESVEDHFYTPFSRGLGPQQAMPGVVLHGQATSQLLRIGLDGEAPIGVWPEWGKWLWVFLWSSAGAFLGLKAPPRWRLVLVAGGLAGLGVLAWLWFVYARWVPLVAPALALLAAAGVMRAYLYYRETVERAQLMQLFSRHVAPEVADMIWQHRDEFVDGSHPRPERMTVTALFTDLAGFTVVSEKQSPEVLLEWLNEYMDAMAREVSRYHGVIRQYAGDAVVAVFGIPVPRKSEAEIDQDARSAVLCALGMETALRALNRRWKAQARPTTGMRVGIYTGPVTCGTLGSTQRSEYVVVGDTVNTASRLESLDKTLFAPDAESRPIRILVGEPTLRRLGSSFVTEDIGEVSLKGKEHQVRIYRVLGLNPEPGEAPARSPDSQSATTDPRHGAA